MTIISLLLFSVAAGMIPAALILVIVSLAVRFQPGAVGAKPAAPVSEYAAMFRRWAEHDEMWSKVKFVYYGGKWIPVGEYRNRRG